MEGKEDVNFDFAVKEVETQATVLVAPESDNPTHELVDLIVPASAPSPGSALGVCTEMKKKRGRPRKYGPDGKVALALSPMPISSSIPLAGGFPGWEMGKGRQIDSEKKSHKHESAGSGERVAYYVGGNFTPHVITVNAGEDVTKKVMSFSQQGSRAICILSATGTISNVTLHQPASSGGTLTYEGRFQILSLSGSFMPTDNEGTKSISGGISVSLAGPDGRVVGGGLAGLLIAAGPVEVVLGSFLQGHQMDQKPKKQRIEHHAPPIIFTSASAIFGEEMKGVSDESKSIPASSLSFHMGNSASTYPVRNYTGDDNVALPGEELKKPSQSNSEVSC